MAVFQGQGPKVARLAMCPLSLTIIPNLTACIPEKKMKINSKNLQDNQLLGFRHGLMNKAHCDTTKKYLSKSQRKPKDSGKIAISPKPWTNA
jgi:hypothetical protein